MRSTHKLNGTVYKKRSGSNKKIVVRFFITFIGIAFIFWGLATIALGFTGEKGIAVITSISREMGERNEIIRGRYTYNISYTFNMPNGRSVNGLSKHIGDATFLKADGKSKASVRYFSFFPYINALEEDTRPGAGQFILVAVGCFLVFIINRRKKNVAE